MSEHTCARCGRMNLPERMVWSQHTNGDRFCADIETCAATAALLKQKTELLENKAANPHLDHWKVDEHQVPAIDRELERLRGTP